jgi:hypothetical protein
MHRIPTLYLRDPADRRFVMPLVQQGAEWVLAGEGVATRMYDGVCVLFDPALDPDYVADVRQMQGWWRRRELKPGALLPDHFHPVTPGGLIGWTPADRDDYAKFGRYLVEAVRNLTDGPRRGTHELLGPKINRNPERIERHVVIAHADADLLTDAPRDFEGLSRYLLSHSYEGIVWHHPDGRMAKLKRKDVRR